MGAFAVFMIIWGIPTFGIYDYKDLYNYSWSKPVYLAFVNYFYRPYISHDIDYMAMSDIKRNPKNVEIASIKQESATELTKDYFMNQAMWEMGFSQQDKGKLDELLGRLRSFESERFTAEGKDTRFFWLLFANSADAKQFIDLANSGASQLPSNQKSWVNQNVFALRRANFVAIGIGAHGHRMGHITQRWGMSGQTAIYAN